MLEDNLARFNLLTEILRKVHAFLISITFITNTRLKQTKNQEKAKQHPEAKFLLFGNYSLSSSALSFKNNVHIQENVHKNNKDPIKIDLGLDMVTNILDIKNVSV